MTVPRNQIMLGDVRQQLDLVPDDSVDTVITSPPYFALRNYGQTGQLGQEATVEEWVANLADVLDDLTRVLKPSGTVWLNVADRYSRATRMGAVNKSLVGGPERLMLELMSRGWIVRNRVVWAKPNPLPDSVKDRLATSHEVLFLLSRSPTYFFDLDAIRIPHVTRPRPTRQQRAPEQLRSARIGRSHHPNGKNPGDVWTIATSRYNGAHFATFPEELVRRPVLATVPERICRTCGQPWLTRTIGAVAVDGLIPNPKRRLSQGCGCQSSWRPGLVLDPFMGAGTVGVVAQANKRDWLGIELNPIYKQLALQRIHKSTA